MQKLGAGGFAHVYLVRDVESYLDVRWAVKIPATTESPGATFHRLRSQYKHWKVLSESDPDRFVKLSDVRHVRAGTSDFVGIFMEYVAGGDLAAWVETRLNGFPRNQLQIREVLSLFVKACEAVRSLHNKGMVHRDIKPANLLLSSDAMVCKLSDFELVAQEGQVPAFHGGTPGFMSPECHDRQFSRRSDVYSLGVTLYAVLTGWQPEQPPEFPRPPFRKLSELNPILPADLDDLALQCVEAEPENRPQDVDAILNEILRLGLTGDPARSAPANLARLLELQLPASDKSYLVESLARNGFRSYRTGPDSDRELIEEYCYTVSPREALADNCTSQQLPTIAGSLGLPVARTRDELIDSIVRAIGFRPGLRQIEGIESALSHAERQMLELTHASKTDECTGIVQSCLITVEQTVDMLVRFFGQLIHGSGMAAFVSRLNRGKTAELLTFGQKVGALRRLCLTAPEGRLPLRVQKIFEWPVIGRPVFDSLDQLVAERNRLAHRREASSFREIQREGRQTVAGAIEVLRALSENTNMTRVVQITSREDDVYGRHFYMGRDDRNRSERIFTALPLDVGQVYLFFPVTNPARINPIIFPLAR